MLVNHAAALNFLKRKAEKFNPKIKPRYHRTGRKAIPVTILKVEDRHYTFRLERPPKNAGSEHYLFLDKVRSTREFGCLNFVTY